MGISFWEVTYEVALLNRIIYQIRLFWNGCFVCISTSERIYLFKLHARRFCSDFW